MALRLYPTPFHRVSDKIPIPPLNIINPTKRKIAQKWQSTESPVKDAKMRGIHAQMATAEGPLQMTVGSSPVRRLLTELVRPAGRMTRTGYGHASFQGSVSPAQRGRKRGLASHLPVCKNDCARLNHKRYAPSPL